MALVNKLAKEIETAWLNYKLTNLILKI
jgi:hypothetical protein